MCVRVKPYEFRCHILPTSNYVWHKPPALPTYKKGIIEQIITVMHTLFTFCAHHTSNHKILSKIVDGTRNPTKTNVILHKHENVLTNRSIINTIDWDNSTYAQLNGHMT